MTFVTSAAEKGIYPASRDLSNALLENGKDQSNRVCLLTVERWRSNEPKLVSVTELFLEINIKKLMRYDTKR